MATYAIGDIQGCYDEFMALLELARFKPKKDKLWVAGDMINRGPNSLETLRYIKNLGDRAVPVLGNHDLHLLAIAHKIQKPKRADTAVQILQAPDRRELLSWLRKQPLIHYDKDRNYAMVHAGIPPEWSLKKALLLASEVETVLRGSDYKKFLVNMYGDSPCRWDDNLRGWPRLRIITNYLTRMRLCDHKGGLEYLHYKMSAQAPSSYKPWFAHSERKTRNLNIIFGHWAALNGKSGQDRVFALDTGCVWGQQLTMMRLEDQQMFSLECAAQCTYV